jgi:F0F1-type ATP synthase membrane subunit b/b'
MVMEKSDKLFWLAMILMVIRFLAFIALMYYIHWRTVKPSKKENLGNYSYNHAIKV